jgi:hypothetical protein
MSIGKIVKELVNKKLNNVIVGRQIKIPKNA